MKLHSHPDPRPGNTGTDDDPQLLPQQDVETSPVLSHQAAQLGKEYEQSLSQVDHSEKSIDDASQRSQNPESPPSSQTTTHPSTTPGLGDQEKDRKNLDF